MAVGEAFGHTQRIRLTEAVHAAERQTGMHFPLYVGPVHAPVEGFTRAELERLAYLGPEVVLLVVDPAQRVVQIATSPAARSRLDDNACALATLSMTTSFGLGDLVGGLSVGLRMLADATTAPRDHHGRPAPTSSTVTRG